MALLAVLVTVGSPPVTVLTRASQDAGAGRHAGQQKHGIVADIVDAGGAVGQCVDGIVAAHQAGRNIRAAGGKESAGAGGANLCAGGIAEGVAQQAKGIGGAERNRGTPAALSALPRLTPELLGDIAVHFGDAHFQHHLLAAGNAQHIDDLLGVAGEAGGQIVGAGGFCGGGDGARQDHIIVHRRNLDRRIGQIGGHHAGQIGHIFFHTNVNRQNLMAGAVKEKGVGLAGLESQKENALGAAHHGVHDIGAGNQDVMRLGIQFDDRRLAHAQRDGLMRRCTRAGGNVNDAGASLGR